MVPLRTLRDEPHRRRASAARPSHLHSRAAAPAFTTNTATSTTTTTSSSSSTTTTTTTVIQEPQSTILYSHRKQPTTDTCAQSILHSSSSFDERVPSAFSKLSTSQPRLTNCELLISVLECYMTLQIRRNQSLQACEPTSPVVSARHSSRELPSSQLKQEPSVFHALQPPSITPVEYLRRLARYAFCSRSAFILAFYYLQKIAGLPKTCLTITSLSIHRLLLTATLLATKMVDDILYDNAHFAKVGGLDVKELNMLELDMLSVLRFELCVSAEQFEAFERSVLSEVLSCDDSQYAMLHERLRNMGYAMHEQLPPSSPVSSLDDFDSDHV
eukprot:TRINITY_DN130_c2_g2_i1.p1 TRINITY_DN130_c2_g2~~TRINITY_DN130_c2_g2_i1.p1  ORF type:complete len:329 (+),score=64.50 TRINITY_DN130_c2_g2_i1:342-1328(+)